MSLEGGSLPTEPFRKDLRVSQRCFRQLQTTMAGEERRPPRRCFGSEESACEAFRLYPEHNWTGCRLYKQGEGLRSLKLLRLVCRCRHRKHGMQAAACLRSRCTHTACCDAMAMGGSRTSPETKKPSYRWTPVSTQHQAPIDFTVHGCTPGRALRHGPQEF